jgi:XisI protein
MDPAVEYADLIERVMRGYASFLSSKREVEATLVIDATRRQFLLLYVGWDGPRRVHHVAVHVEVRGDRVWLQCDNTDLVVAEDLVAVGIPKSSIVLGFRAPELRPHTGYAA